MYNGDVVHFLLLFILDGSAIASNFILIVAIIRHTPCALKIYSTLLLFSAIVDCNAAFMSLMATVIVQNLEGSIIFVYLGPCRLIHERVCYAAQGENCMSVQCKTDYSSDPRAIDRSIITFSNSPSPPPLSLLNHAQLEGRLFSVFNMTASHLLSTENILPRVSIGYIICLYSTASPILFVLRRKLLAKIHVMTSPSEKFRHHMIFRSLTMQMFLPLSFSFGFVFWLLDFLGVYRQEVLQRAIMPISSTFAVISPLIILYYLPPYRKFFVAVLTCSTQVTDIIVLPDSGICTADQKFMRKASVITLQQFRIK